MYVGKWIVFDSWLAVTVELICTNTRKEQKSIRIVIQFQTVAAVFETSKVSHLSDERKG
jgi:hypothetical protein